MTTTAPHADARKKGVRSFDVADFPALTGREEEWRFTPLKRLRGLSDVSATGQVVTETRTPEGVTAEWIARDDDRLGRVLVPFDRISAKAWGGFDKALV